MRFARTVFECADSYKSAAMVIILVLLTGCGGASKSVFQAPPNTVHQTASESTASVDFFGIPGCEVSNCQPIGITNGPNGQLWFADYNGGDIGEISTGGTVTLFPATGTSHAYGITTGPDKTLWYTLRAPGGVGRITSEGVVSTFLGTGVDPLYIINGPDGNLWFSDLGGGSLGRVATDGTVHEFPISSGSHPEGLTTGPDGKIWFADESIACSTCSIINKIGSMTTSGQVTEYDVPNNQGVTSIVAGADKNLWFTLGGQIGRATVNGVITRFDLPAGHGGTSGAAVGPGDTVWFTDSIGFLYEIHPCAKDPSQITAFNVNPGGGVNPLGIAEGPDGNMWFTSPGTGQIGRLNL